MAGGYQKNISDVVKRMRHGSIICVVGILVNIFGFYLTGKFNAPFSLGAVGTILASAMGGYLPGVVAGFAINIVRSLDDYNVMSYGFIDMLVAVMTNVLAKKGFFDHIIKAISTIPFFALLTGILRYVVSYLIEKTEGGFATTLLWELVDKSITVALVVVTIRLLPEEFLIKTGYAEQHGIGKVKTRSMPIRGKILIMLSAVCILIAAAITSISYMQYRDEMIQNHIKIGRGAVGLIKEKLDPEKITEYIENTYEAEGYTAIEDYLYDLRDNLPDAEYIYVYRMMHTGIFVVFDLDTDEIGSDEPGSFIEYEPVLKKLKNKFLAGENIEPTISRDKYGFLLSIYEPLFDEKGFVSCYVGVDFSMDVLNDYIARFIIRIVTMFIGFVMLIFALFIKLMEINIVIPVNEMSYCAGKFSYKSEEDRQSNIDKIKSLNIRTGDEIENLYVAFCKTVEDGMYFVDNLRVAQDQVITMTEKVTQISMTAYTDSLTGVKNKASYQKMREKLEEEIERGETKFAIVMIDINRLKHVNDTYGHEKGDIYIRGSCKMICDVYKHSPVYRFGGDEFVVLLIDDSYEKREQLLEKIRDEFAISSTREDVDPWKRYSAAVGMSEYTGNKGEGVDDVFKRADESMYEYKVKMKANRRD